MVGSRHEFFNSVQDVVGRQQRLLEVRGSFRNGDFHLDRSRRQSFSDLDLVARCELSREETGDLSMKIHRELLQETGLRVKVSIHPDEFFEVLSPADARFLAIGEYMRLESRVECDPAFGSYHRAKCALLVGRMSVIERYRDVAHRLDTPVAEDAINVKLGRAVSFPVSVAKRLLSTIELPEALALRDILNDPPGGPVHWSYLGELRSRPAIPAWLRALVADLVEAELNRTGT